MLLEKMRWNAYPGSSLFSGTLPSHIVNPNSHVSAFCQAVVSVIRISNFGGEVRRAFMIFFS